MEQLKRDLNATRRGLSEVRKELADRPTRKQFNAVVVAAVLVVIAVCVAAYFAVQSATDSDDAKEAAQSAQDAAQEVIQGFAIQDCRAEFRAELIDGSRQRLEAALQSRASAIQKRDNLTIEALQFLAQDDLDGVAQVALQAPGARDLVTWTDAVVQQRVKEADAAQRQYQKAIDLSIKDPDRFIEECESRGN